MDLGLKDRVAVVAAASQGLGKAVALNGAGHFNLIDPRSKDWPAVQKAILNWHS